MCRVCSRNLVLNYGEGVFFFSRVSAEIEMKHQIPLIADDGSPTNVEYSTISKLPELTSFDVPSLQRAKLADVKKFQAMNQSSKKRCKMTSNRPVERGIVNQPSSHELSVGFQDPFHERTVRRLNYD